MTKIPQINKPVDHFIERIRSFLVNAAGTNRGEIQKWLIDEEKLARKAYTALKKEQEICTIMHPQSPQKLNTFFYVPRVTDRNNRDSIEPIELLHSENNSSALISGMLGQGKSMFLRYLQFLELNTGSSIPIFLNLHKIEAGNLIEKAAIESIKNIGLECSKKLFLFLMAKGHITLFLDGYDEISFEKRGQFNDEVIRLTNVMPGRKVFITSRYDTEIEKLPGIEGFDIEPLNSDDHAQFIKKIVKSNPESDEIMKKLSEASEFDSGVLNTPLLLTWFVMVYKNRRKIPKTKIGFYEELFKTILSRHDGIKESFDRPSKSKLSDDEIESILYAFCYITSKNEESSFDESEILARIKEATSIARIGGIKEDDYLYDLTHITCLLIKDGMSYNFLHDSIQSYFSACFIKGTNESNSKKFYSTADNDRRKWIDELNFLYYMDSYRFNKFMILPSIASLTGVCEEELYDNKKINTVNADAIKKIYGNSYVLYIPNTTGAMIMRGAYYLPSVSATCHFVFNSGNYDLCETDKVLKQYILDLVHSDSKKRKIIDGCANKAWNDSSRIYLDLMDTLSAAKSVHDFVTKIHDHTLREINKAVRGSVSVVQSEESKGDLF